MLLPIPRDPKYGWIPDLPDHRDFPYSRLTAVVPPSPEKIDLRRECSPVENQGNIGSCTACALVGNLEFIKKQRLKKLINFSILFLYYNERVLRHTTKSDSGASVRDGIKTLVKIGDCLDALWPYDIRNLEARPSSACYTNAHGYEITKYFRLQTISEMKHTLSTGCPFVFGIAVYESFEAPYVSRTGIVPMPKKDERLLGGHAVMAVGYEDTRSVFIVRNSWGPSWGDHGYFYLPYDYLSHTSLSSDYWTIRDTE